MTSGAAEINESALGEEEDLVASWKGVFIHLRLDVGALDCCVRLEFVHFDLVVEMPYVADDGLILHALHVLEGNDTHVASCGDINVGAAQSVLKGGDLVAFHRSLKGINRINFSDYDPGALSAKRLSASLSDITVATDDSNLAGNHNINCAV